MENKSVNSIESKEKEQNVEKMEIMAPAGSWESLNAAINAGANSVYFGVGSLNMRARAANNFQIDDLKKIVSICKENNVKSYLTLNIVYYDEELDELQKLCDAAKNAGITAVIAADVAAIEYARSINLEVHISTQANVSNYASAKFYSRYADVVVLARELRLEQIEEIYKRIQKEQLKGPSGELLRIELFVHGAMCVSISGKCYMSLAQYNHSANRGDCLQTCRRKYKVTDEETGDELIVDNQYVMSPKDLCTIGFIDKFYDAGVRVMKIEGRGRSPDYVYKVTKAYREAANAVIDGTYDEEKIKRWITELESVFNRGFWHGGYYLGNKLGEWSATYGSKATKKKSYIGQIQNYYAKAGTASLEIDTGTLQKGDEILVTGPTTGAYFFNLEEFRNDEGPLISATRGELVTFPVKEKVRKNDKVYVIRPETHK